jgi:hypothetical protein
VFLFRLARAGIASPLAAFDRTMTTITEIHAEIERLSEVRAELWQALSRGRQQALVDEIKQIDEQLVRLWDEHRAERARIRFGERDEIVRRARQEERLERAA